MSDTEHTAVTIPTVELTAQQMKMWGDTRAAMIWHCPAFSHIFYTMMSKNNSEHVAVFTTEVPIAATDGKNLLLNPETFFTHNLQERLFVVGHEILHAIFGHCEFFHKLKMRGKVGYPDGKELGYDHDIMNKAADYVINDMLIESKIGQYNANWLHDKVIATHMDEVLTAYRRLYDENQQNGGSQGPGNGPGQRNGQSQFDKHMAPGQSTGQDPHQAAGQRNEAEWKTAIAGAYATGRAQGKMPAALERALNEVLEPKVDWRDKIIGFFARKPGGGGYNWRTPDRRFVTRDIIAPSRSGFGAGPVVVAIDTSGSITPKVLDMFMAEIYGILDDVRPTQIILMWCDAKIGRIDEIEDTSDLLDARHKGAPGGGGTSFIPVFEKISELGTEIDALIYLTDGLGSFPDKAPSYPVLWGNLPSGATYPFGEVVDLPK